SVQIICFEQQEEALATAMFKSPYTMDPDYIKKLITQYHIGGLIFLYKSTPDKQIDAINEYQALSKVPLLITQDCEWGLSMRLYNTTVYPRNNLLGMLADKSLIYDLSREIARQCSAVGVHMNFAPVVDINNNPNNKVIGSRSFGSDLDQVAHAGLLMMQGLQDEHVLACAKHFPGHGDTSVDSHLDLPIVPHDMKRLEELEIIPFKHLIDHGIASVMSAHLAIPKLEKDAQRASSLSYAIVTDLLEHELHFSGLKVTDALGMGAITKNYAPGQAELEAVLAGNDLVVCPLDIPRSFEYIGQAIRDGKITEEELDRRVLKILKAKEWSGAARFEPIDKEKALEVLSSSSALALQKMLEVAVSLSTRTDA
ncbi:MAG: serine hydrolase, partial [Candidatus Dependentiae bacterium]|nr:serine hydrolase [Candidatus Dependentiae bacterium]